MAVTSSEQKESTKFSTCLGNEELTLELDQTGQFIIELANASRFVVYTKVIIKQDEVREITGIRLLIILLNFFTKLYLFT